MISALWRSRWGLVRLVVASLLLWAFASDTGSRLARLQLAAMPGYDFLGAATALQSEGRLGEAVQVIDAGLELDSGGDGSKAQLATLRGRIESEQASWIRRAKDVGLGAVTGQGQSLERLIGAVGADFFLVGDIRDILIQSTKQVVDGESDKLILALSAAGVVTTLAPEIDWAPSLLKAARKAGALSTRMVDRLVDIFRGGKRAEAVAVMGDVATLAKKASPGGAVRLMKLADSPAELRSMAAFVERQPRGAFALGATGRAGLETVIESGAGADRLVVKAAAKGERGAAFLRTPAARAMLRPHALIGVAKGLTKGTLPALVVRAIEAMDAKAWWFVPLLAAWVFVEMAVIGERVNAARRRASLA